MPGAGSLSSVVSGLVRAQMGASVSSAVSDGDLDRHVADLIVKEAKEKAERYASHGVRAYLPASEQAATRKPDKRFLSHIIRRTDDHNRSVLKAQADAAAAAKAERDEIERRERRARAEEAAEAERQRRRRNARGTDRERRRRDMDWDEYDDVRDRDRDRERERKREGKRPAKAEEEDERRERRRKRTRRLSHDREGDNGEETRWSRRSKSRSTSETRLSSSRATKQRSPTGKRSLSPSGKGRSPQHAAESATSTSSRSKHAPRTYKLLEDEDFPSDTGENTDFHWRRSRSPRSQPRPDFATPSPGPSPPPPLPPSESTSSPPPAPPSSRRKSHKKSKHRRSSSRPRSPSYSPPPPPPFPPSKMDKYFESSYDPRLDVAPLSMPTIPATGLIDDADFAGWEAMLELIKQRRQDKEEKKWLEKHGFTTDVGLPTQKRKSGEEVSVMDIQYKKRGSVREWDMGKDGVD